MFTLNFSYSLTWRYANCIYHAWFFFAQYRCGHLFGQKCVERWLKDGHQKCPQCNAKAKRADIRVIYAKKLQAIDTVDLEQALK